jgi:hypothetical protein
MRKARSGWQEDLQERDEIITEVVEIALIGGSCITHGIICAATSALQRPGHHHALSQSHCLCLAHLGLGTRLSKNTSGDRRRQCKTSGTECQSCTHCKEYLGRLSTTSTILYNDASTGAAEILPALYLIPDLRGMPYRQVFAGSALCHTCAKHNIDDAPGRLPSACSTPLSSTTL